MDAFIKETKHWKALFVFQTNNHKFPKNTICLFRFYA
jgi:hypothetical protein